MIRFILKNADGEFRTVDVYNEQLETLIGWRTLGSYEIVGRELIGDLNPPTIVIGSVSADSIVSKDSGNNDVDVRGTVEEYEFISKPEFPKENMPVISKDEENEHWRPGILHDIDNDGEIFETCEGYYNLIAPLLGNEHLIDTEKNPPYWWEFKDGKVVLKRTEKK